MTDTAPSTDGVDNFGHPPLPGHNRPPEGDALTIRLAEQYKSLPERLVELLGSLDRAPQIITTDDQNKQASDLKKELRTLRKTAEAAREKEKDFFLSGGRRVDGWFAKVRDPAEAAMAKLTERKTAYEREVAAVEQRRRDAEERKAREEAEARAEEAERLLREAAVREEEAKVAREKLEREAAEREAKAAAERKTREAAEQKAQREALARETAARDAAERAAVAERNRADEAKRLEEAAHARGVREAEERAAENRRQDAARAAAAQEEIDLAEAVAAQKVADLAAADAVKAQRNANAKAADMSRSRSDYGAVSSLHTFWDHKPEDAACGDPVDRDKVDLEPLRPYLNMEALDKAVKALVKAGGRELRGQTIFENTVSRG